MGPAMSRFTERPMARANEHLASARYAEAAGAFRAVLRIDPNEFQAHFGLADALVARGERAEAVNGLVAAAESCTAREDNGAALTLYGKALSVDPMRLELHLDVAMAEAALGRMEAAQTRLEHLAEVYMQAGRTDEAAEVYRCLAGWEGDGEAGEEEEVEAEPVAPSRTTLVPSAAPARAIPAGAVPMMMMPSSETVVIATILVTPDGQLMQVPAAHQPGQPLARGDDSVPPIPAELLEVVHSAPIDLAAGEEIEDVERTVVGFPPPPPTLPEESAVHNVNRATLEAAVVAALDNLAQLEEEDMTIVMQRLPPQPKGGYQRTRTGESRLPEFVTRSRMVKPELPPEPEPELDPHAELEADADLAADPELDALPEPEPEPTPESKLRIRPAPRPVGKPEPRAAAPAGGSRPVASKAAAPAGASRAGAVGKPAAAPSRPAAAPVGKAAAPRRPAAAPVGKASVTGKPAAAPSSKVAAPASKAAAPARKAVAPSRPSAAVPSKAVAPSRPAAAPASKAVAPSRPAAAPSKAASPAVAKPVSPGTKPSASKLPASSPAGAARPAAGLGARPSPASSPARAPAQDAAPKATRPDNPLAERLRRRAGLQKPDAVPGRPTEMRPTEPITVRTPPRLPPVTKTKK